MSSPTADMARTGVRLALEGAWQSSDTAPILGPIHLTVGRAETVAITGPSGAGKTTLLRIIAGLHAKFHGTVDLPGKVAMVFQEPLLLPWRSALDNMTLTTGCSPKAAGAMLGRVGLSGRETDFPGQFSLGQQRRLALARAFLAEPSVLLMDEPFVSLDAATADEMMTLFETLRRAQPLACLLVTHERGEAARLADRTLVLSGQPAGLTA